MSKFKRLNILQIISVVLVVVSFILFMFNIPNIKNLFWTCLGLNLLSFVKFTDRWSREGKTGHKSTDKRYDKNLTRKSSEIIFYMLLAYAFMICLSVSMDIFIKDYMYSKDTIVGLFVFSLLWNYMALSVVDKTYREVVTLIKTNVKNKRKENKNENKRS